jgi:hypothetical protein
MRRHHSAIEVALIVGLCVMSFASIAALYRAQLGFEWPDLGIVEAGRVIFKRVVG